MEVIANRWLAEERRFRGLILRPQEQYKRMGYGELVARIEALFQPFPYPVIHLKPRPGGESANPPAI